MKGGYSFARPPSEVTVLEVVDLLEGELGAEAAASGPIWTEAADAVEAVLGATTIADVAERETQAAGAQMYDIQRTKARVASHRVWLMSAATFVAASSSLDCGNRCA